MSVFSVFDSIGRDIRHAVRTLPRRPAFAVTATLTLALGVGATTAIFAVVYSVLIKPLPYPGPGELVRIRHSSAVLDAEDLQSTPTMYFTYRDENETLAEIGFWGDGGQTLTRADGTERVRSLRVTHGVLQALGVRPASGRWFNEAEHEPGAEDPQPIILSHAFAQTRLGGDAALGLELLIDGDPARVVGIMPNDFRFLDMAPPFEIIVARRFDPATLAIAGFGNFHGLARLRPGITPEEARTDLQRMLPIWLDSWPIVQGSSVTREALENWQIRPVVRPLKDDMVGGTATALWVLMAAIGSVLLIACANIANLTLVRADARRQELAIRASLGALPVRIARELLVESLVIGAIGGAIGLALAYGGVELLSAVGPSNLPRLEEIAIHPPVLLFTAAAALVSTIAFGSIPAFKYVLGSEKLGFGGLRGGNAGHGRGTTRNVLVIVQVALALLLVVSAVLMLRTFQALRDVDPGFTDASSIQTVRTWAPTEVIGNATQYVPLQHEMLDSIAAVPGVTSVGFASVLPMEGGPFVFNQPVIIEGREPGAGEAPPPVRMKLVSPGYLRTMGTRIVAGRDFTWADIESGGRVAIISEDMAREFGTGRADALGQRLRTPVDTDAWREVIGVAESVKEDDLYAQAPSIVYWPALMENAFGNPAFASPAMAYVARSARAGTASLNNEIRQAVWSVRRDVPIALERTMEELYAGSLARTSFALVMLAVAGSMALALGLIGIYGVVAYVVAQRSREIGIRMALGAGRRQVRMMFLRQGLWLSATGLAIGLAAALGLTRLMSSLLFGIEPTDVVAYLAAIAVILAATALASYLPARRAARIQPTETLRAE